MPFYEYIKPDQGLRKEIESIINVGLGGTSEDGLVDRKVILKELLIKWREEVSENFVVRVKKIMDLAAIIVDASGRPVLPNVKDFTTGDTIEFNSYHTAVKNAWENLIEFYENKKAIKSLPSQDPRDLFVRMTDELKNLSNYLKGYEKREITRDNIRYLLADDGLWPGHIVCEVKNTAHAKLFRQIAHKTQDSGVDLHRYRFYNQLPIPMDGEQYKTSAVIPQIKEKPDVDVSGMSMNDLRREGNEYGLKFVPGTTKVEAYNRIIEAKNDPQRITEPVP